MMYTVGALYFHPSFYSKSYLAHHGILGQKWGIRRYQPYPKGYKGPGKEQLVNAHKGKSRGPMFTESHVIPKGTKMYRTVADPNESMKGSKYVTYLQPERDLYRGGYIRQQRADSGKRAHELELELTEDLRVPGRQEYANVVNSILSKNPKLADETAKSIFDVYCPKGSWTRIEIDEVHMADDYIKDFRKKIDNVNINSGLGEVAVSLGINTKLKTELVKELSSRGYNALVDEASVGGNITKTRKEGIEPLIVFDAEKSLSKVKSHEVSEKEEKEAQAKYLEWQRKVNSEKYRNGKW